MLERHELSAIWGDVDAAEYAHLVTDIQENGYLGAKIVLLDGKVLDGWHRYTAALDAGLELHKSGKEEDPVMLDHQYFVDFRQVHPNTDPVDFVISLNARRRHLTPKQRARAVLESRKWGDPEYKAISHEEMAAEAGVSESTLHRVKREERAERGEETPPHGTAKDRGEQLDIEDEAGKGEGDRLVGDTERRGTPPADGPTWQQQFFEADQERKELRERVNELESSLKAEFVKALETALAVEQKKVTDLAKQVKNLKVALKKAKEGEKVATLSGDVKAILRDAIQKLRTPSGRLVPKGGEPGLVWAHKLQEAIASFTEASGGNVESVVPATMFDSFVATIRDTAAAKSRRQKDKVWGEGLVGIEEMVNTILENLDT